MVEMRHETEKQRKLRVGKESGGEMELCAIRRYKMEYFNTSEKGVWERLLSTSEQVFANDDDEA